MSNWIPESTWASLPARTIGSPILASPVGSRRSDHDDQFDLSDTLVALAISMLALTALTHKKWLYWLARVPTAFGVLMGLAGLFGWHLHSDTLARLLS